eukprot:728488-Pelagomonas_calceolata.AAC.1
MPASLTASCGRSLYLVLGCLGVGLELARQGLPDIRVVGPMVGANLLEQTPVLALFLGLCGRALSFRTGDLSLMNADRLGLSSRTSRKVSLSLFSLSCSGKGQGNQAVPHLFSSAPPSSASRFGDFMNQADVLGLA